MIHILCKVQKLRVKKHFLINFCVRIKYWVTEDSIYLRSYSWGLPCQKCYINVGSDSKWLRIIIIIIIIIIITCVLKNKKWTSRLF